MKTNFKGNEFPEYLESEFRNTVIRDLKNVFPDAKIEIREIEKMKNRSYTGVTVSPVGKNIGVSIELAPFFQSLIKGESYNKQLHEIEEQIRDALERAPKIEINWLSDYEYVRERLVMQLVSTEREKDYLQKIPHMEIEDISVVFRILTDCRKDSFCTILIDQRELDYLDVTIDRIYEDARILREELVRPELKSIESKIAAMIDLPGLSPNPCGVKMYVGSCYGGANGASCMLYPEYMERVSEVMQGDFYILPSSVHELIFLPADDSEDVKRLKAMVSEINRTELSPEDVLTDSIYRYSNERKVIQKIL